MEHESLESLLDLSGKVAVVTGGGQGFGYACGARFDGGWRIGAVP